MRTAQRASVFVSCVALALGACRTSPVTPDGISLRGCKNDDNCPTGLRCDVPTSTCFANSVPTIQPFQTVQLSLGMGFSSTAAATDVDDDVVTVRWQETQNPGTPLLTEPLADATLAMTPSIVGTYVFEAIANDSIADGPAQPLTVIITNAPPMIDSVSQELAALVVGDEVVLSATASDADTNQTVTLHWRQTSGADLGLGEVTGTELTVSPDALGFYGFEVFANDGTVDGPAVPIGVLAQPALDVIYVSDLGAAGPDPCGTFLAPCPNIADGIAAAAAASVSEILLAAPTLGEYLECITVEGDLNIRGGFDPYTWEHRPEELRGLTRLRCNDAEGHTVTDNASLRDLALFSGGVAEAPDFGVVTLRSSGGAPLLTDIDVWGAACGASCFSLGIGILEGTPTLQGVEVTTEQVGFSIVGIASGILSFEAAPIIRGRALPAPETFADPETTATWLASGRGGVTLSSPTNEAAVGLQLVRSTATVEGLFVAGGLGPYLSGIVSYGGDTTIEGNLIDLTGFGTLLMQGIAATSCDASSSAEVCDCPAEWPGGVCPAAATPEPVLHAIGNAIDLRSAAGENGLAPCVGTGVSVFSARAGSELRDNWVTSHEAFSMTLGMVSGSAVTADTSASADAITGNRISLDAGRKEAICEAFNIGFLGDFNAASLGLVVSGHDLVASNNTVVVGPHTNQAAGIAVFDVDGARILDNDVFVSETIAGVGTQTPSAVGMVLDETQNSASIARGNLLVAGDSAESSTGLVTSTSAWLITSNFIHGGWGMHSIGLMLVGQAQSPEWPKIIHNTILGGARQDGLTSKALQVSIGFEAGADTSQTPIAGVFYNNLADAGDAAGRRYLIDNPAPGIFSSASAGNLGQFDGIGVAGPQPVRVVPPITRSTSVTNSGKENWGVLLEGSGQFVGVWDDNGTRFVESDPVTVPARPTASFAGALGLDQAVAVVAGDRVFISILDESGLQPFQAHPLDGDFAGSDVEALAIANVDGAPPPDLVFLVDDDLGRRVMWKQAAGFGQYGPAQALAAVDGEAIENPQFLVPAPDGRSLYILDQKSDGYWMLPWPLGGMTGEDEAVLVHTNEISEGAAIGSMKWMDLGEGGDRTPDLAAIVNGQVVIWKSPVYLHEPELIGNQGDLEQGDQGNFQFPSPPCGGAGAPNAVNIAAGPRGGSQLLFVQCDDGEVWKFQYATGPHQFSSPASITEYDCGMLLPCDIPVFSDMAWRDGSGSKGWLAGVSFDFHRLVQMPFDSGSGWEGATSHSFLHTVGYRVPPPNAGAGNLIAPNDAPLPGLTMSQTATCLLTSRDGGAGSDLHLADPGSNPCVNPNAPAPADTSTSCLLETVNYCATDFDGDARPASSVPDLGADEAG